MSVAALPSRPAADAPGSDESAGRPTRILLAGGPVNSPRDDGTPLCLLAERLGGAGVLVWTEPGVFRLAGRLPRMPDAATAWDGGLVAAYRTDRDARTDVSGATEPASRESESRGDAAGDQGGSGRETGGGSAGGSGGGKAGWWVRGYEVLVFGDGSRARAMLGDDRVLPMISGPRGSELRLAGGGRRLVAAVGPPGADPGRGGWTVHVLDGSAWLAFEVVGSGSMGSGDGGGAGVWPVVVGGRAGFVRMGAEGSELALARVETVEPPAAGSEDDAAEPAPVRRLVWERRPLAAVGPAARAARAVGAGDQVVAIGPGVAGQAGIGVGVLRRSAVLARGVIGAGSAEWARAVLASAGDEVSAAWVRPTDGADGMGGADGVGGEGAGGGGGDGAERVEMAIVTAGGSAVWDGPVEIGGPVGAVELELLVLAMGSIFLTALVLAFGGGEGSWSNRAPPGEGEASVWGAGWSLAGPGERVLAFLADIGIGLLAGWAVGAAVGAAGAGEAGAGAGPGLSGGAGGAGGGEVVAFVLVAAGAAVLHSAVGEAVFGRTVGKLLLGLRTVSDAGRPIGVGQAIGRNVARVCCPALWIMVALAPWGRHPGSFGTWVVKKRHQASGAGQPAGREESAEDGKGGER